MQIHLIEINNYRVFYGRHRIHLTAKGTKREGPSSLAVIMGKNGTGKSVMLDSVIFVLFGLDRRGGNAEPKYSSLMNRHAREKGEKVCYVYAEISVDQRRFGLKRELFPSGNTKITIYPKETGEEPDTLLSLLENHISPESAKYLFYSFRGDPGEKLRLSSREAINSFLGINILDNSKRNLAMYHTKIFKFVERNTRAKELGGIKARMKKLTLKRKELKNEVIKRNGEIRKLKRDYRKKLKEAYQIKGLGRVMDLHQRLQKKIYRLKKGLSDEMDDQEGMYDLAPYFLIKEHINEALAAMKEKVKKRERTRYRMGKLDAQLELVESLFEPGIKAGICGFCDSRISNSSLAVKEVYKLKDDLRSEIGVLEETLSRINIPSELDMDRLSKVVYVLEQYMGDLKKVMGDRSRRIAEINKLKTGMNNLLIRFPTLGNIDGMPDSKGQLQRFVDNVTAKRRELNDARLNAERVKQRYRDMGMLYEEEYSAFKNITMSIRASITRYLKKMDLSKKALNAVTSAIQEIQKENRGTIEAGLNRVLTGLFSKKGVIERVQLRKSDYSLAVKIASGGNGRREVIELEEFSDGEKVLIFISLVWSLNRMREDTTIIYDSPFSFLDSVNKGSIVKYLPRLPGSQVMLTTKDDLSGVKDEVLHQANRVYEIVYQEAMKSSRIVGKKIKVTKRIKQRVPQRTPRWVPISPGKEGAN